MAFRTPQPEQLRLSPDELREIERKASDEGSFRTEVLTTLKYREKLCNLHVTAFRENDKEVFRRVGALERWRFYILGAVAAIGAALWIYFQARRG